MKHVKSISARLQKHASFFIIAAIGLITNVFNTSPLQAQTIHTSTEKLKAFEGYYQFEGNGNAFLEITAKGDSLMLKQLWDNREFPFHQTAALEFYCDAQSFPLKFKDSAD
jgi:hypothetical protein